MQILDGYKTYLGGAGLIVLGLAKVGMAVAGLIGNIYPDILPGVETDACLQDLQTGGGLVAAGLSAIGIGHKIVKGGAR